MALEKKSLKKVVAVIVYIGEALALGIERIASNCRWCEAQLEITCFEARDYYKTSLVLELFQYRGLAKMISF